jgi:hypothetical protein
LSAFVTTISATHRTAVYETFQTTFSSALVSSNTTTQIAPFNSAIHKSFISAFYQADFAVYLFAKQFAITSAHPTSNDTTFQQPNNEPQSFSIIATIRIPNGHAIKTTQFYSIIRTFNATVFITFNTTFKSSFIYSIKSTKLFTISATIKYTFLSATVNPNAVTKFATKWLSINSTNIFSFHCTINNSICTATCYSFTVTDIFSFIATALRTLY